MIRRTALFLRAFATATVLSLSLSACGDQITRQAGFAAGDHKLELPVGIGPDSTELKKSPCACLPIELMPPPESAADSQA